MKRSYTITHAFTLLELLVSIGIIVILAAFLLPIFGKTRAASQQTVCLSNLRQIYTGLLAYSQDYRGYLPRGGTGSLDDTTYGTWRGVWFKPTVNAEQGFPAYVGGQEVADKLVLCPANRATVTNPAVYITDGYPYVCNYEAMTQNGLSRAPANLWRLEKKDELGLIFDGAFGEAWKGPGFTATSGWERIGDQHKGQFNVLWADGHVSGMKRADLKREMLQPVYQ